MLLSRLLLVAKRAKGSLPRLTINAKDVREQFIRSRGPGGQSVNKRSSAVRLVHEPSGIGVKMDEQRSQSANRRLAWRLLRDKVEEDVLGSESRLAQRTRRKKRRKERRKRRAAAKYGRGEEEEGASGRLQRQDDVGDERGDAAHGDHEEGRDDEARDGGDVR